MYNSHDGTESRINASNSQRAMIDDIGAKWNIKATPVQAAENDDSFRQFRDDKEARSEADAFIENVKHDNLITMFLKGTEVDDYLAMNLFGKERLHDDMNRSFGDNTLLDRLNLDETFTG